MQTLNRKRSLKLNLVQLHRLRNCLRC
uniref:Uncharacterized protein n=1 Tax=Anguilla anguilla TaxID=7936 RepID=A0A0E9UIW5_ANGAN